MFDFVSNKPEGDDWQIRIRGSSMWVSYGDEDAKVQDLGTAKLTKKEIDKVWKLVDAIDIPDRKKARRTRTKATSSSACASPATTSRTSATTTRTRS